MFDIIIAFIRWLFGGDEFFEEVMPLDPMDVDYLEELEIYFRPKTIVSTNETTPPRNVRHTHYIGRLNEHIGLDLIVKIYKILSMVWIDNNN